MKYVLAYDIGTTGVKTCLFSVDKEITLVKSAQMGYGLYILPGGGAEQEAGEWWKAMVETTRKVFAHCPVTPDAVAGISFCSQMQGLVLVDKAGVPVRRPMSYMDQRAGEELKKGIAHGLQIAGANVGKLLTSLRLTGAVSSSVKDPLWKYHWVKGHEPDNFRRVWKWLDVKEYLILRMTGEAVMTRDSAYATFLYDSRRGRGCWSEKLAQLFDVDMAHLPKIVEATDAVGGLTAQAASELGLVPGTPVFGGGGDASLIGVGAGATKLGSTHIYCGTSGWVITVTEKQLVDVSAMIAAIVGAQQGRFNYFAEMETAGKCLEWVKDHLALDEIGIYLKKQDVAESQEAVYTSLYDYMSDTIRDVPPRLRRRDVHALAPWKPLPLRGSGGSGHVLQYPPGDRQDRAHQRSGGGCVLPPQVDAGLPEPQGQNLRPGALCGRRRPLASGLPAPGRYHRPGGGGGGRSPERGRRGRGGGDGRGLGAHRRPGSSGGLHPRGGALPARSCQNGGL